jgi:hypothetical protein
MRGGKGEETLRVQGPLPPVEEATADEGDGAETNPRGEEKVIARGGH